MSNIISLFRYYKLMNVNDARAFLQFGPNKYLQKQCLLKHLQNLKLPVWLTVCNILLEIKFEDMEQISNQLLNGKVLCT